MDKRLEKRHKRQVARAKAQVRISEPDVRTPEQIKADREASQPAGGHSSGGAAHNATPTFRNSSAPGTGSSAKTDA